MRLLSLVALLLCIAAAPPDLLARAARASGEPWRFHVVSESYGSQRGHLTQTKIDAQGDRIVTRSCSGGICSGTYQSGSRSAIFAYNETPIPQTRPVEPRSVTLRAIASYEFTAPSFRDAGGTVEPVANDTVRVTAPGGAPLDARFDGATGLVAAVVAPGGGTIVRFEDLRRVGGLMLPFKLRRADGTVESFEERSIDPSPLVPPAGPSATFDANGGEVALSSNGPRFPCTVETQSATCLLDTGASGLSMSLDLADRLHKSPVATIALQGLGTVLSGVVRADSLRLGGMRLGPALYAVLPDAGGFKADVVVGADVIGRAVVRLDLHRRTIAFAPLGSPLQGTPVALGFDGFTPTVDVRLDDLGVPLAIDTGDEASIDLPVDFYREHPALFTPRERRTLIGVGGRGVQSVGRIARVGVGPFQLSDVPIGATEIPGGGPTRPRVGADFLARFVVELDYANARLGLRKDR